MSGVVEEPDSASQHERIQWSDRAVLSYLVTSMLGSLLGVSAAADDTSDRQEVVN
jgi:hypothetical protein